MYQSYDTQETPTLLLFPVIRASVPRTRQECYNRTPSPIGQQLAIQARYVHPEVRRVLFVVCGIVFVLLLAMWLGLAMNSANSDAWYIHNMTN